MGDETAVLQAYARRSSSPYSLSKLFAIYLDVPLHLFPEVPLALGLLAAPLVTLSNMSTLAILRSFHF